MANYNVIEENVNEINNLNLVEYNIGDKTYRNLVYIPENYNQDTPVFMYGHGYNTNPAPNNVPEFGPIYDYISNNNPNSIIVMSLDRYTEYYGAVPAGQHMYDFLGVLKDNYNINGNNVMFAGFSSGGPAPLAAAMAMRAENPNSQPVVVTLNPICYRWLFYETDESGKAINKTDSDERLNMLDGITIVDLYNQHDYDQQGDLKKLSKHGANVVRAYINGGHSTVNKYFFEKCIVDFQSGNGNLDFLNEITFKKYNAETNEWVKITDRDEIERIFLGMAANYNSIDIENLNSQITDEDNFMKNTIDANKKSLMNLSPIKCDNEFIKSNGNNIINKIKGMNYLKTATRDRYSSTTQIPNIIIEKSYEIELTLENKLEILAQCFYNLAKASDELTKMDNDLDKIIGTTGGNPGGGGWYFPSPGGGSSSGGITPSPSIPSPTPDDTTPDDKTPDNTNPEDNKPGENEKPDNTNPEDNKPNEDENKPSEDENKPSEDENKPSEDENKEPSKQPENNSSSTSSGKKPSSSSSKKPSNKKPSSSGSKDKNNNSELPPIVEIPDEPLPEEPIPEEPIPEEPIIPEPEPEPEIPNIPIPDEPTIEEEKSSPLKTIGILTGVGALAGAGAYAAHKIVEKKKNEEDREEIYSDYGYEGDNTQVLEEETSSDQVTPFDENNE